MPDRHNRKTGSRDRVRQMLRDLDTPLDALPRPSDTDRDKSDRDARNKLAQDRKMRQRSDLKRARDAARRVFKVKPSLSSRKTAAALLTASAVGLAAFSGPAWPGSGDGNSPELTDAFGGKRMPASLRNASAEFKQALIEEEGVRYVVYRDVAGYPTVGVGHLVTPRDNLRVGDRISRQQVLEFLEGDLVEAESGVRELVGDLPLFQHEFDALVDLVYNVGAGNVSASESPRLNAAVASGDYRRIATELDYTYAGGRIARGLEFRSERRAKIFLDARYEDPREAARNNT
ncbi:lysozyme [Qipengyuania spongiae]|uniref:Lysozyme n=1 Tax=Qipengyuania spongiae TaxID=2909673 RepID=A0ABY5SWD5_9SPHN|nr:lysozyme [Qipengyuania spongiae]UVI38605.1 lysozyme [Qipengyuania spongiae]